MQEHDLSWVRTEMALAQAAPPSERGFVAWVQKNLFASVSDTILTVVALLFVAWLLPPILNWVFLSAQWSGTDRSFCATVAQGGIQPDGWSGACWAFVNAKFEQFMFGRYPISERWRVILTGIIFVALLVPLMVPRAPYKALNAFAFFGAFPIVAFMLLIGAALPFGLVGFAGFLINLVFSVISGIISLIFAIPAVFLDAVSYLFGIASSAGDGFRSAGTYVAYPFDAASQWIGETRGNIEGWFGYVRGLWIDLLVSAVIVLGLMRWYGASGRALLVTLVGMVLAAVLIRWAGLDVGLPYVETALWGGLLVTLVLSYVGISVSLPLGIVLALGRRSKMPVVKMICVVFIEAVRGVPLVTVLFMASVMLPLFLPPGTTFDKLLRALIGVALFASAYMAEVIRGGLQAIPRGQYEGADSLGLGYWQKMTFIVMPQALKLVIPGIVNSFIGLFKDTTLVSIVAIFDLLGGIRAGFTDPQWATPVTLYTGFAFAGIIYFAFCYFMSRYSIFVENRLNTGRRR